MVLMRAKNQLTLPARISEAAHLQAGDPVDVELVDEGILLRPRKVIDASQAWFWTNEWQRAEREASADIAAGRLKTHRSARSFLDSLKEK